MSIVFSGSELINIAVGIEKQGVAFYDVMARSTRQNAARDVFSHLADIEREHIATFQGMLTGADRYELPKNLTKDYNAYLQALVNTSVFTDDEAASELATHLDSPVEALDIAIRAEKDSILFYYVMKEIMPATAERVVEKIIGEEKFHLSQLSALKRKIVSVQ